MFTFFVGFPYPTSFTIYELNQGGWDGWIGEAIEVEMRMFECGRRTEETEGVAEMTPILYPYILYPVLVLAWLAVADVY